MIEKLLDVIATLRECERLIRCAMRMLWTFESTLVFEALQPVAELDVLDPEAHFVMMLMALVTDTGDYKASRNNGEAGHRVEWLKHGCRVCMESVATRADR